MAFVAYPSTPDFPKFRKAMLFIPSESEGDSASFVSKPRKGTFIGTVKLHGTNASIIVKKSPNHSDPIIQYQSRNRIITTRINDDNQGAANFLSQIPPRDMVAEILRIRGTTQFEEIFIAGEWAGTGIQKGVAIATVEKFFAIFNIRIDGHWVDIREYKTVHAPTKRVYNIVNFPTFEITIDLESQVESAKALEAMKQYTLDVAETCPVGRILMQEAGVGPSLKKGGPLPLGGEGIVWTMIPTEDHDTELFNFKTKHEQFATVNAASRPKLAALSTSGVEVKVGAFVDFALGERRLEQGIEYLQEMGKDPSDIKSMGDFLKWVVGDVMKEEGWRLEVKDDSGRTLLEEGVSDSKVKKAVGDRARAWFIQRRNNGV